MDKREALSNPREVQRNFSMTGNLSNQGDAVIVDGTFIMMFKRSNNVPSILIFCPRSLLIIREPISPGILEHHRSRLEDDNSVGCLRIDLNEDRILYIGDNYSLYVSADEMDKATYVLTSTDLVDLERIRRKENFRPFLQTAISLKRTRNL